MVKNFVVAGVVAPATGRIMIGVEQVAILGLASGTNGAIINGAAVDGAAVNGTTKNGVNIINLSQMEHHSISFRDLVVGVEYFLAEATRIRR